jgi:hypothetical protein
VTPDGVVAATSSDNAWMPRSSHTVSKIPLHEHPVEPPGGRPPRRPLLYLAIGVLVIFGALFLIDAVGLFGK